MKKAVFLSLAAALFAAPEAVGKSTLALNDIHWPGTDAYCTFLRKGQPFKFDDTSTWKFVAITNLADSQNGDPMRTTYLNVNGRLREMVLDKRITTGGEDQLTFHAASNRKLKATFNIRKVSKGAESWGYMGALKVSEGTQEIKVEFTASCGV